MKCTSYENFFMNFSNKTKFKIIMHLKDRAMSVNELSTAMGEEQSKVSHSLSTLAKCNILSVERKGKSRVYTLNKDTVLPIIKLVEKHVEKHCDGRCAK